MILRYLADSEATGEFGAELWTLLPTSALVFLHGDLGAGKTTLVRAYLRAGGFDGPVKSPTYNLVEEYHIGERKVLHFDLYRLIDPEELEWMGIRDYFAEACVCFIEWPDKGNGFLPEPDFIISLSIEGNGRQIQLETCH